MRSSSSWPLFAEDDNNFKLRIDNWVASGAKQNFAAGHLLKTLPGIWPGEVIASLHRLESAQRLSHDYVSNTSRALCFKNPSLFGIEKSFNFVPVEHPLDFEWRFAREGRLRLFTELERLTGSCPGKILCLGCPTLFASSKEMLPEKEFVLWDKNASGHGQISEAGSLVGVDLRYAIPKVTGAVAAILDPPWYNDFYRLFLWAALQSVQCGGYILLSFPPEGTRPSAARDFKEVAQWAQDAGAKLISRIRGCIPYCSPFFEFNALNASGLFGVPLDWRRGDLVIFQNTGFTRPECPSVQTLETPWQEHCIESVKIRVRTGESISDSSILTRIATSDILPSVSTRFPGRSTANFVTSGNRFFRVDSPQKITEFCQLMATDPMRDDPLSAYIPDQLFRLVETEKAEMKRYFAKLHDL